MFSHFVDKESNTIFTKSNGGVYVLKKCPNQAGRPNIAECLYNFQINLTNYDNMDSFLRFTISD